MFTKSKPKKQQTEESVEAKVRTPQEATTLSAEAKKLADEAIKQSWDQMIAGTGGSIMEQIFGSGGGDLAEGQEVSLTQKVQQAKQAEGEAKEKKQVAIEHIEYFRTVQNADRIGESKTESEVRQAVEQIRMEIKRLASTSKVIEQTVKDATADKAPIKPGKYHLNFFQFVLSILRDATQKLEDSASYGAILSGKKQQSKYWTSYKKHGTSFGLSGERSTATQTG